MEQNEEFKKLEAKIKVIEQRLSLCDATANKSEQSGKEAIKEIEENFAKCINALAERKAFLLKEVAQHISSQKKKHDETRFLLGASVEGCKQVLRSGSFLYPTSHITAENVWKSVADIPVPHVNNSGVKVNFSPSFFDSIQKHGIVLDASRFSRADKVITLNSRFNNPFGVCLHNEYLYITDSANHSVRKVNLQGESFNFGRNHGLLCPYYRPSGIVSYHKDGSFFVFNNDTCTIVHTDFSNIAKIIAGSGKQDLRDGIGSAASFMVSRGMTIDQHTGNLFVTGEHSIRKVTPQGEVSTLAGSEKAGFANGNGKTASFDFPNGIAFEESTQSLLVCDGRNRRIRRVQLNGDVSTLCSIGACPNGIAVTSNGTILVTSSTQVWKVIHKEGQKYEATVLAGTEVQGSADGSPSECSFNNLRGIAIHEPSHSCFVVDHTANAIRKISFIN